MDAVFFVPSSSSSSSITNAMQVEGVPEMDQNKCERKEAVKPDQR
jgi:hypothetical protein